MASRLIDLISKKANCTCSTFFLRFFVFPLPLFCTTKTVFCTTKTSNFLVTHYFYGGIVVYPYPIFCFPCSCSLLFFTAAHLKSPCWPIAFLIFSPPLWISMFYFLRNSSPLFSITRSSSLSVIHVSVNIRNNAEKDTTLLLFFLSKSPGSHVISFQIKPWVAFGLL